MLDFWAVCRCDVVLLNEGTGFVRVALAGNARRPVFTLTRNASVVEGAP